MIVDKIRTIVRLEYKFDDDYIDYDHIDCIIDDWGKAMRSLWESYFGDVMDYRDVLEVIMGSKEEGWDEEQVVAKLLDYYADWVLEDYQYERYAAERDEAERKLYREVLAKNSEKLGVFIDELMREQEKK